MLTPFIASLLIGQITPHSALKNFKLPKYNENSYRAYTLSGVEGIYDKKGYFEVSEAELSIYSGDEHQILQTQITTNLANFDLQNDSAEGDSIIEIKNEDFYLRGRAWKLDLQKKRITIESEGVIRFYKGMDLDITEIF